MFLNLMALKKLVDLKFSFIPNGLMGGMLLLVGGWYLKHELIMGYLAELFLIGVLGSVVYLGILWLGGGISNKDLEVITKFWAKRRSGHDYGDTT